MTPCYLCSPGPPPTVLPLPTPFFSFSVYFLSSTSPTISWPDSLQNSRNDFLFRVACREGSVLSLPSTSVSSVALDQGFPSSQAFSLSASQAPPLKSYWLLFLRVPPLQLAARLPAPFPLFSFPLSHEAVANPKWEGRSRGRERGGKRAESERHGAPLFPLSDSVLDCSGPPLYCGIAAPSLRRSDPQGSPLESASCRP